MEQIIQPQTVAHSRPVSPAELKRQDQMRQTAITLGTVAFTVVVLSLVALGLNWTKNNHLASVNKTIKAKQQELNESFGAIIQRQEKVSGQLSLFKQTTAKPIDYKQDLWDELSSRAVKQVRLTSLSLKENKATIEGEAESFGDIAKQIISWRQSKIFKNVSLQAASTLEGGKKQFSASFDFKPNIKNKK